MAREYGILSSTRVRFPLRDCLDNFSTPGMDPLYSGVTTTIPLDSRMACAKGVKAGGFNATATV